MSRPGPGRAQEVSDRVHAFVQPDGSWMINNSGFVAGSSGVLCVDACATERRTRDLLAAIAEVTAAPVRTLVNTHHHPDHTAGNGLFPNATIVAHEQARPEMRALGLPGNDGIWSDVDHGDLELRLPFLTFTDRVAVWVDDLRCELIHPGRTAHTTNDVVVWIPERSVLFAGDLVFNGGTPFLLSGSVRAPSTCSNSSWRRWRPPPSCPATARCAARRSSTRCWTTCASSSASPRAAGKPG